MLSSGAHVKIGNDEFHIDRSVQDHYIRRWYDLDDQEDPRITGDKGKQKRNAESLFWTYTDWAGGEGNRVYNPDEPDKYDVGYELNGRIRGQLTGRPNRRVTTVATKEISDKPCMTVGAGAVWVGGGYQLHYSTSGPITWTSKATSGTAASDYCGLRSLSTSYRITCMAGDNDFVYYSAWHSGSSGSRVTLRAVKSDSAVPEVVEAQATGKAPYAGMALQKGDLFAWTGRKLYQMEVSNVTSGDSDGLTGTDQIRKVYDTGVDPASSSVFSADWWADCIATENSIIMFYSNDGISRVYEYKKGVGRPIWTPPYGFTIKAISYSNGVVLLSGHWGGDEDKAGATAQGVLYALPLGSYQPFPVHNFRDSQNLNLQMQVMSPSYGYQTMIVAAHTGRVFIYDAQADGVTMLDDLEADPDSPVSNPDVDGLEFDDNDHRVGDAITWGLYRYLVIYRRGHIGAPVSGSGTYQIVVYDDDRPEQRETGLTNSPTSQYEFYNGYFETPRWDYGYPLDKKSLIGFHLTFKPLASGQTIDVSYCVDASTDSNTFTSLTQITSATTGASVGRVFIPVSTGSSTVKFVALRYRVTLKSSSGVQTPILYSVSAEAKCTRKRREWELVLRVKDEPSRNPRPSSREARGWRLRDSLETTIETGSAVTFLDGYRYAPDALYGTFYSTHNVVIKQAEDTIDKPGEGSMRILLRSVDASD